MIQIRKGSPGPQKIIKNTPKCIGKGQQLKKEIEHLYVSNFYGKPPFLLAL